MLIRDATPADAPEMAELLNELIALGGTTAHQLAKSAEAVRRDYVDGAGVETSVVAQDATGRIIGWQSIGQWQGEPHIGSFVRAGVQARGVGAALWARTVDLARVRGLATIHAWIRADNSAGLAYYARIGFRDYGRDTGFAMEDGGVVGRIFRRFDL